MSPSGARVVRRLLRDPLQEALDWIEQRSIFGGQADWPALRREALAIRGRDRTTARRGQAINFVLRRLGDRHALVLEPHLSKPFRSRWTNGLACGFGMLAVHPERVVVDVTPGGPAACAGVRVGDRVETLNGKAPDELPGKRLLDLAEGNTARLTLSRAGQSRSIELLLTPREHPTRREPSGRALAPTIAYVELPRVGIADAETYVLVSHELFRAFDGPSPRGWVLDLRRNTGGDVYALLAAAGPLLGDGEIGGMVDVAGRRSSWTYRSGQAFDGADRRAGISLPYELEEPKAPVAVLTSRLTASAAEALTIAFRARDRSRSLGEATFGVTTGLEVKVLSDGMMLAASTWAYSDRAGGVYLGPVEPDEAVVVDWSDAADQALQSACRWLAASLQQ
jgi:carboxyl-terminal processing protease